MKNFTPKTKTIFGWCLWIMFCILFALWIPGACGRMTTQSLQEHSAQRAACEKAGYDTPTWQYVGRNTLAFFCADKRGELHRVYIEQ